MATIPSLTTSILAIFGSGVPATPSLDRPPSGLPAGETAGFPLAPSSALPSFFGPQFTGSGTVLTDRCATAEYTLIDDAATAYYAPFIGCMDSRPECCPFNAQTPAAAGAYPQPANAKNAVLASCPVDYFQVSGSCCPNAFTPWTAALGGQTPCYSALTADATLPTVTTAGPVNATGTASSRGFSTSRGGNVAPSATASANEPTVTVSNTVFAMQYAVEANTGGSGVSISVALAIVCSAITAAAIGGGLSCFWKSRKDARRQRRRREDARLRMLGPLTPPPGPAELPATPAPQSNPLPQPQGSHRRSWVTRGFGRVLLMPPSTEPLPQAPTERPYFRPIPVRANAPVLPELPGDDASSSHHPTQGEHIAALPPPPSTSPTAWGSTTTIQPPQAAHHLLPPEPPLPPRHTTTTTGATNGTTTASLFPPRSGPSGPSSTGTGTASTWPCTDASCMCLSALEHRASVLRYEADVLEHQASRLSHHHRPERFHGREWLQQRQQVSGGQWQGQVDGGGRQWRGQWQVVGGFGQVRAHGQSGRGQGSRQRRQGLRQKVLRDGLGAALAWVEGWVQPVELEAVPARKREERGQERGGSVPEGRGEGHGGKREEGGREGAEEGRRGEHKERRQGGNGKEGCRGEHEEGQRKDAEEGRRGEREEGPREDEEEGVGGEREEGRQHQGHDAGG